MKKNNNGKKPKKGQPTNASLVANREPAEAVVKKAGAAVAEPEVSDAAKAKLKAKGVQELIALGKEKGHLTYDDINRVLPGHVTNSDEIEDVLVTLSAANIEVSDSEDAAESKDSDSD